HQVQFAQGEPAAARGGNAARAQTIAPEMATRDFARARQAAPRSLEGFSRRRLLERGTRGITRGCGNRGPIIAPDPGFHRLFCREPARAPRRRYFLLNFWRATSQSTAAITKSNAAISTRMGKGILSSGSTSNAVATNTSSEQASNTDFFCRARSR